MSKTIHKQKLNQIINAIEDAPCWLKILGKIMGPHVEAYAEQYHDQRIKLLSDEKKYYYDVERPKVKKQLREFRGLFQEKKCGTGSVTDEMIELAREYPLENLVDVNEHCFAHCINHDEKTASMYCKNNYAHCFGCGFTGDTIRVYQKINNADFVSAVKYLSRQQ